MLRRYSPSEQNDYKTSLRSVNPRVRKSLPFDKQLPLLLENALNLPLKVYFYRALFSQSSFSLLTRMGLSILMQQISTRVVSYQEVLVCEAVQGSLGCLSQHKPFLYILIVRYLLALLFAIYVITVICIFDVTFHV